MPTKLPKNGTTVQPVEFRVQAGLHDPAVNLFIEGEISRQVISFPKQERTITALQVTQALNEAFMMGLQLGHLATKEAPKKRTKKTAEAVEVKEEHVESMA